jgi:hypothetical protein
MISGMANRYKDTLTQGEREQLEGLARRGKSTAAKFIYARALLLCDAGEFGDPWRVADVASALGVTSRTLEHLKQRFVEEGLEAALARKPHRKPRAVTFDGEFDARLSALACSQAPAGRQRWTVRLLADRLVELKIVDAVSTMTVQRSLKKPTAASSEQLLEYPARPGRGVRRRDGGCAGGLSTAP